jgi:putative tryptophan/tyrosine transport system substrate-binding protein
VKRRAFIVLLGGAAAWPLRLSAQRAERLHRVGILAAGPPASRERLLNVFKRRLADLGWQDGRNLTIEYRSADGHGAHFAELATELSRLNVDVIVALGTPAALAAKEAARGTIPIVVSVGDVVGSGLVSNLARPGGNITGVSDLTAELSAKRLEILKATVSGLSQVVVLWNATNPGATLTWKQTETAGKALGLQIHSVSIRSPEELEQAITNAAASTIRPGGALLIVQDPLTLTYRDRIVQSVARIGLPAIYGFREFVEAGGLMSYAAQLPNVYRTLAESVDKILRGTAAADMPVQQPTKFELVINLKTAKALSLEIPPTLLGEADEVIE